MLINCAYPDCLSVLNAPRSSAPSKTFSSLFVTGPAPAAQAFLLDVRGMRCGGCVASVRRVLEAQEGVGNADVNLVTSMASIAATNSAAARAAAEALSQAGYPSAVRESGKEESLAGIQEDASRQELVDRYNIII